MAGTTGQSAVLSLSLTSSRAFCYTGTIVPRDRDSREEVLAMATAEPVSVERVQLGVRMEKRMVKVLKGLAEFNGVTLGQLLERIVLHSFDPVPGQEGEMAASPHSKRALEAIADLKRIYGMDYDTHATRRFHEDDSGSDSDSGRTSDHPAGPA